MHTARASPISRTCLTDKRLTSDWQLDIHAKWWYGWQTQTCTPGPGIYWGHWMGRKRGTGGSEETDRRPARTFFKPSKSSLGNWKWQWAVSGPVFACQRRRVWIYLTCFCPDKSLMCQPWQITCKCCFFIPRRWDDLRALPREIKP